jgi:hypothetical protein
MLFFSELLMMNTQDTSTNTRVALQVQEFVQNPGKH